MSDVTGAIASNHFRWLCEMLKQETAIVIDSGKSYLVEARLQALARAEGCTVADILERARCESAGGECQRKIIEAMTTNETSFFRDPRIFRSIETDVLQVVFEARPEGEVRIWCAASSTGQEPYSIAMAIAARYPGESRRVRIVATDIDTQALTRAREGVYSQLEVNRGLPASMLVRFFEKRDLRWHVKPDVRDMVSFEQLNLAREKPPMTDLDLVLIRNVLIYFEPTTKSDILTRVSEFLSPSGLLILGGTESALGTSAPLVAKKVGHCTVYQRRLH